MPESTVVFGGNLTWAINHHGNVTGIGTDRVNLDANTANTGQVMSETFTLGAAPQSSPDGKWDELRIQIDYKHVNTANSSTDQDIGAIAMDLRHPDGTPLAGGEVVRLAIQPEDGPTGTFTGTYQAVFHNVPPGTYRLFVGETNSGDGEELSIRAHNIEAFETVCFTAGVMIETDKGAKPVEMLRCGDLVRTRDNGLMPIRWISSNRISFDNGRDLRHLQPIRIAAGALGPGAPQQELTVSPQHRILIRSRVVRRLLGIDEVLVPAKKLVALAGVDIVEGISMVEYFHFMLDSHQIVFANGAETESLYLGPIAKRTLNPLALEAITAIFPEFADEDFRPQAACAFAPGNKIAHLVEQHKKPNLPLVEMF